MYDYFQTAYVAELDKRVAYPKKQDDIRCNHWCFYTNYSDTTCKLDIIAEEYFSFWTLKIKELEEELFWVENYRCPKPIVIKELEHHMMPQQKMNYYTGFVKKCGNKIIPHGFGVAFHQVEQNSIAKARANQKPHAF